MTVPALGPNMRCTAGGNSAKLPARAKNSMHVLTANASWISRDVVGK